MKLSSHSRRPIKERSAKPDRIPIASTLVALSGGPDSVALLHWLVEQARETGGRVYAAHVNYRLRGAESEADERFCRELCRKLKVRLFVKRLKAGALTQGNLQAEARRIRYEFFDELCRKHQIGRIATGHNKTDHAETFLMNLSRGAGTFGLAGMKRMRGNIVRPLLDWSRAAIEAYLRKHRLKHRTDASNLTDSYLRNRVRRRVLPILQEVLGERTVDGIDRSAGILAEHEEYLRQVGEEVMQRTARTSAFGKIILDLTNLRAYHQLIRRIVLALCFEKLSGSLVDFDFEASERFLKLVETGSGTADLKLGIIAEAAGKHVYLYRRGKPIKAIPIRSNTTTRLRTFGLSLSSTILAAGRPTPRALRGGGNLRAYVDADQMRGRWQVRQVKPGDRFRPLGMRGEKKLSDLFIDRKVDRPLREEVPILLVNDRIVWVIGHALSEEVKITEKTKKVLMLEVEEYRGH